MMSKLKSLSFRFLLTIAGMTLVLLNCGGGGSTEPSEQPAVSGRITLEGSGDLSGIQVRLFNEVTLDAGLSAISTTYSNAAFPLSQESVFDHRQFSAVASATTGNDGSYEITGVGEGSTYIMVVSSDDIGFRYVYNVTTASAVNLDLRPVQRLSGNYFNQPLNFENDYILVEDDVFLDPNSNLTFSGDNIFVFGGAHTVTVRGNTTINTGANLHVFGETISTTGELLFENHGNLNLRNLLAHNDFKLAIDNSTFTLTASSLQNTADVALSVFNSTGTIENSIFLDSNVGANLTQFNNGILRNAVFLDNSTDLELSQSSDIEVSYTLFQESGLNLELIGVTGNVHHNDFLSSTENIIVADLTTVSITENVFRDSDYNIRYQRISHQKPSVDVTPQRNNYINTAIYVVELRGTTSIARVFATDNYWGTTQTTEIDELIFDRSDLEGLDIVTYEPFSTGELSTAGVNGS